MAIMGVYSTSSSISTRISRKRRRHPSLSIHRAIIQPLRRIAEELQISQLPTCTTTNSKINRISNLQHLIAMVRTSRRITTAINNSNMLTGVCRRAQHQHNRPCSRSNLISNSYKRRSSQYRLLRSHRKGREASWTVMMKMTI